ncbi:MAG: hypothetical protein KA715_05720 [Xanthomonadaceae bacterium]|nr:hypothetical protein [Xanthomonadaceae bacterium]
MLERDLKPFVKVKQPSYFTYFCAQCNNKRILPMNPNPGRAKHFFQVALTAGVIMLMTWSWFEWKGVVSFIPLWIGFEVMFRMKLRAMIPCPICGFDPYLQLIDSKRATEKTVEFWKKKFEDNGLEFLDRDALRMKKYRVPPKNDANIT